MLDKTQPKIINGLNVDDVATLIENVRNDPANGATKWKVSSVWKGRTHSRSTVSSFFIGGEESKRDFAIDIDEPEELGGGNRFANPQEYLLAALNACMMVGYVALCSLNDIRIDSLEIETEGDIDLRGFFALDEDVSPGYERLKYKVRIKGDAAKETFEEIHEAVMRTSPNYYNLSRAVPLGARLEVI